MDYGLIQHKLIPYILIVKHLNWTVHQQTSKRELKSFPHIWSFVIKLPMSHLFLTLPKKCWSIRSEYNSDKSSPFKSLVNLLAEVCFWIISTYQ